MTKDKDKTLVEKALTGDQRAYSRLMNRYKENIFFYILKMIGNKTIAGDLTIETFSKAFRQISDYSENYAFSTWLYKIARNTAIDYARKRKINTLSIDYDSNEESVINESSLQSYILDPEQSMIKEQEDESVKQLIDSLSPKYKDLIRLRYFKDYAYEEIAAELDIPVNTVKTRLFRAKNILAESLSKNRQTV